ncbi:MAG: hypothetical protein Q4G24_15100 [Paracoccus sp. (in: a-proteobacteria)]|uniref:hypothetical protein n=1 Tax=Paracoccus sp. TaxID=267 RepID=UPI0026DFA427|nr:hypothetical protein [Paracoccus sp. (in: a-proteobacteria)]MDO5622780.1 hypothetical protein [Paracoccus sp. (in: a-proteobacteria)]
MKAHIIIAAGLAAASAAWGFTQAIALLSPAPVPTITRSPVPVERIVPDVSLPVVATAPMTVPPQRAQQTDAPARFGLDENRPPVPDQMPPQNTSLATSTIIDDVSGLDKAPRMFLLTPSDTAGQHTTPMPLPSATSGKFLNLPVSGVYR